MNGKLLLGFLGVIVLCVAGFGIAGSAFGPHQVDPSQGSINMVQPSGWFPGRDQQYAEHVNLPNSEANRNNGQANVYNAQAEQIEQQTWQQSYEDGRGDFAMGGIAGAFITVGLLVLVGGPVLYLILKGVGA